MDSNSIIADTALAFCALSQTLAGRDLLLKFVSDDSLSAATQGKPIVQLTQTVAVAIDLIDQSPPSDAASVHPAAMDMLAINGCALPNRSH
jgi:hypothetical protein